MAVIATGCGGMCYRPPTPPACYRRAPKLWAGSHFAALHTPLTRPVDAAWLPTIYPPVAQRYFRAVAWR